MKTLLLLLCLSTGAAAQVPDCQARNYGFVKCINHTAKTLKVSIDGNDNGILGAMSEKIYGPLSAGRHKIYAKETEGVWGFRKEYAGTTDILVCQTPGFQFGGSVSTQVTKSTPKPGH